MCFKIDKNDLYADTFIPIPIGDFETSCFKIDKNDHLPLQKQKPVTILSK